MGALLEHDLAAGLENAAFEPTGAEADAAVGEGPARENELNRSRRQLQVEQSEASIVASVHQLYAQLLGDPGMRTSVFTLQYTLRHPGPELLLLFPLSSSSSTLLLRIMYIRHEVLLRTRTTYSYTMMS